MLGLNLMTHPVCFWIEYSKKDMVQVFNLNNKFFDIHLFRIYPEGIDSSMNTRITFSKYFGKLNYILLCYSSGMIYTHIFFYGAF